MAGDRYTSPPGRATADASAWDDAAEVVLLDMLTTHYAVTVSEIEARGSDRVYNPLLWPKPINPHHFTNARKALAAAGALEPTSAPSRSHPEPITTWSRPPSRGLRRLIQGAAARKRLLTARHAGWARRGGAGRGLIGRAGEDAVDTAMREAPDISSVSGSTTSLLGVELLGEVDNSAFYVDTTGLNPTAVILVVEVKNTRSWYYPDDPAVLRFLAKAAHLQHKRPEAFVLPVFIGRQCHFTLWQLGKQHGFLPTWVRNQLVLADSDLAQPSLDEVAAGLGYRDLRLGNTPSNGHRGIFTSAIPARALTYAERWRAHHLEYLRGDLEFQPADDPDQ
ncbi:MAG TPA: hypothetical protein VK988_21100 [Acidimicrobiales bacterium]|nr:hypothetical protein [Acidimicrobiales bacterium]